MASEKVRIVQFDFIVLQGSAHQYAASITKEDPGIGIVRLEKYNILLFHYAKPP
jgi:hypothetical protein